MSTPTHLAHKPITAIDNYAQHDGLYANNTDIESLSIGTAQYDGDQISAKVFRHTGTKWSRQSEELPLHRVIDLNTLLLQSILLSGNNQIPTTEFNVDVINDQNLVEILNYYKDNKAYLLPKLRELKIVLDYFMQEEPKL